jgi:hypothetical protein
MSFRDFRLLMYSTMLNYDPRAQQCLGDENFRNATNISKQKWEPMAYYRGERGRVSVDNFKVAKTSTRASPSRRLCGDLDNFQRHMKSAIRKSHVGDCEMCGKKTACKCGLCNKWMCLGSGGGGCHISLHNDSLFGLARCDNPDLHGRTLKE